jgi:TonB family protein
VQFTIAPTGHVIASEIARSTLANQAVERCVERAVRRWLFPKPRGGGIVLVRYPFVFRAGPVVSAGRDTPKPGETQRGASQADTPRAEADAPLTSRYARVQRLRERKDARGALEAALAWRSEHPGDVLALLALGETFEARGEHDKAARAYGSIIDLFPSRADLRRYAGNRLEALGSAGHPLALDSYQKAVEMRPDHPTGYRQLAYALLQQQKPAEAFRTLEQALGQRYRVGSFAGVVRVLREDLALIGAAWSANEPARRATIRARLAARDLKPAGRPSLRFVLARN